MKEPVTLEGIRARHKILGVDPRQYLAITDDDVRQNPGDANAYFSRHFGWTRLGEWERALEDMNKAVELNPSAGMVFGRASVLHRMGQFGTALADFALAETMSSEEWEQDGLGLLYQADCHARLGDLDKALACCARLPADFWTPGIDGAPAGDPQAIAEKLKILAADAKQRSS